MAQTVSELARRLNHRHGKSVKIPFLFLMTDAKRLPDPRKIIPCLPTGSALIVRHFSRKEKYDLANKIKPLCKKFKVKLLISDDLGLALSLKLDGVHLSEKEARKYAACGRFPKPYPHFLISSACHSLSALRQAEKLGSDTVLISPVFASGSHPDNHQTKKAWGLQNLIRQTHLPCIALGGITAKSAQSLAHTQAQGFAGISQLV